ncbi:MAG: transglutaminase-like domain-containing protein [Mangrovibacterium sp.]
MKNRILNMALVLVLALASCAQQDEQLTLALNQSGSNKAELEKAIKHYKGEQREAMEFLVKYMPERDLTTLTADFLIENLDYAYKAREEFPWAKAVDKEIFFNDVLPYVSLNERRDQWRADFYERFKKYVGEAQTLEEAIWAVNNNIVKEVEVEYNTKRRKADQSPYESMEQHMASCSGLSILLVDAFRAVGIPARVAGTPIWYNNSGNHNWVEVCVNGSWHFTEYYPSKKQKLDDSWFLERAGKADVNNPMQWIYASSYKPTEVTYPLVWDFNIKYVYAENVTDRYISLYATENKDMLNAINLQVVMLEEGQEKVSGNNRVRSKVELLKDKASVDSGITSGARDDMNNFLNFKVQKNQAYQLKYEDEKGKMIVKEVAPSGEDVQIILSGGKALRFRP